MTAPHASQIIDGYLARLERELTGMPEARRRELLDDVHAHIGEARAALTDETDADLLNIVERLGEPGALAAEADPRPAAPRAATIPPNLFETTALIATVLLPYVGIPLVWISRAWTGREKAIVSLLVAGTWVVAFSSLPLGLRHWFFGLLLPVQFLGAVYLALRLRLGAPRFP